MERITEAKFLKLIALLISLSCCSQERANGSGAAIGVGAGLGGLAVGTLIGSSVSRDRSDRSQDREIERLDRENEELRARLAELSEPEEDEAYEE